MRGDCIGSVTGECTELRKECPEGFCMVELLLSKPENFRIGPNSPPNPK